MKQIFDVFEEMMSATVYCVGVLPIMRSAMFTHGGSDNKTKCLHDKNTMSHWPYKKGRPCNLSELNRGVSCVHNSNDAGCFTWAIAASQFEDIRDCQCAVDVVCYLLCAPGTKCCAGAHIGPIIYPNKYGWCPEDTSNVAKNKWRIFLWQDCHTNWGRMVRLGTSPITVTYTIHWYSHRYPVI